MSLTAKDIKKIADKQLSQKLQSINEKAPYFAELYVNELIKVIKEHAELGLYEVEFFNYDTICAICKYDIGNDVYALYLKIIYPEIAKKLIELGFTINIRDKKYILSWKTVSND
jgi:hypothetical protein